MLYNYKGGNKTFVRCICDCGNERIVNVHDVVSGKVKRCSECQSKIPSSKRVDYTGQKFGRLTVLEMLYNYKGENKTFARCICDCGNEKIACMGNILSGSVRSCGCLEAESRFTREHYIDIKG